MIYAAYFLGPFAFFAKGWFYGSSWISDHDWFQRLCDRYPWLSYIQLYVVLLVLVLAWCYWEFFCPWNRNHLFDYDPELDGEDEYQEKPDPKRGETKNTHGEKLD